MPSYRYYPEPEDTPESRLWGGVGKGVASGIERILAQKERRDIGEQKQRTKDKEREERRKEEATEMSDKWVREDRRREERRKYEEGEWDRRQMIRKQKGKEEDDPMGAAKKKQDMINAIMRSEPNERNIQLIERLEGERDELMGFEYTPSPKVDTEEIPAEKPGIWDRWGEMLRGRAERKAQERNVPRDGDVPPTVPEAPLATVSGDIPSTEGLGGEREGLMPEIPGIRVRIKATGETGRIPENEFDPIIYERIE